MFFIGGLDEAGLGPLLGPYTAFLTGFHLETIPEKPLYQQLAHAIAFNEKKPDKLWIADSKKTFQGDTGLARLEEAVLSLFWAANGSLPTDFGTFCRRGNIPEEDLSLMRNSPWFQDLEQLALPVVVERQLLEIRAEKLYELIKKAGISEVVLSGRMVSEAGFNSLLERSGSKAITCQKIISPLLRKLSGENGKLIVDRQGGRKFYGEWIVELFPGRRIQIRAETAGYSLYRVDHLEIGFMVQADASNLETAWASQFAKYIRECAMLCFNKYWTSRSQDKIKPTAGYPQDGRRFINELRTLGLMPEQESVLVRQK